MPSRAADPTVALVSRAAGPPTVDAVSPTDGLVSDTTPATDFENPATVFEPLLIFCSPYAVPSSIGKKACRVTPVTVSVIPDFWLSYSYCPSLVIVTVSG